VIDCAGSTGVGNREADFDIGDDREQGPAVNLLLEAGLEILSRLQLPCVIEGGDGHIVVATVHVTGYVQDAHKNAGC
jgi:hypothetical protein